jgi:hypothetical protein
MAKGRFIQRILTLKGVSGSALKASGVHENEDAA